MHFSSTMGFGQSLPRHALIYLVSLVVAGMTANAKVYFFTYMNYISNTNACPSFRSAMFRGVDLIILGLGSEKAPRDTRHFDAKFYEKACGNKPPVALSYLNYYNETFTENDIIVFNDGSDVIYLTNEAQVEKVYKTIERDNTILFSAEKNCFPSPCARSLPHVNTTYKYVNTGGWIARYPVAVKFLTAWVKIQESTGNLDDQQAVHEFSMGTTNVLADVRMEVDHNCVIFQTAWGTPFGFTSEWVTPGENTVYMSPDGVLRNTETNTVPLFLHFNGNKSNLANAEKDFRRANRDPDNHKNLHYHMKIFMHHYPSSRVCNGTFDHHASR